MNDADATHYHVSSTHGGLTVLGASFPDELVAYKVALLCSQAIIQAQRASVFYVTPCNDCEDQQDTHSR